MREPRGPDNVARGVEAGGRASVAVDENADALHRGVGGEGPRERFRRHAEERARKLEWTAAGADLRGADVDA